MEKGKTTWTSVGGNNDEKIGGNCHVYSHTNEKGENSRVLVDLGGMFPDAEKTDLNRILADPSKYLDRIDDKGNVTKASEKVDAIFLTHCHDDHIGAIPHLCAMGFQFPEIKASPFTAELLEAIYYQQRVSPDLKPKITRIRPGDVTKVGDISIEAVAVSHSAPGALALYIKTPDAKIFHSGDFKNDQSVVLGPKTDLKRIEEISRDGVDAFMVDATSATTPGMTPPEKEVKDEFQKIIREPDCQGKRMVVPLIARSMERFASIYEAAADSGRTIVLYGGSLSVAYKALVGAGYDLAKLTGKQTRVIDGRSPEAQSLKPAQTMVLCTGTQAEENAVLNMASLGIHRGLKFNPGSDIVVMAQSPIPVGDNPEKIAEMLGRIRDMGIKVIESNHRRAEGDKVNTEARKTHASGHAAQEDIKEMLRALTKNAPEEYKTADGKNKTYLIPIHGGKHHLQAAAKLAQECGSKALIHPNASELQVSNEGLKVLNDNSDRATCIGVREKGDFRNPDFDYYKVDKDSKIITEIKYDKTKAFVRADDMGRGKSQKGGKGKGKTRGFDPRFAKNSGGR